MLEALYSKDSTKRLECRHWRTWTSDRFIAHLKLVFPADGFLSVYTFLERLAGVQFEFNLADMSVTEGYFTTIGVVLSDFD